MTAGTGRAWAFGFLAGTISTVLLLSWWKRSERKKEEDSAEPLRNKMLTSASSHALMGRIGPTSSFLTDILRELWTHLNVAGGDKIRAAVEPYFELYLPGPLQTLHFTKIDLGTNPLQMDHLFVRSIQNGMVQVDMEIVWNGNGDIQLQTDSDYPPTLSLGVQNIKLCGQFCLWLKPLANELPVVSAVQYAFVNPPHLELSFSGLAAVADFAVLDKAVRDSINASLLSYVLPNRGLYKLMASNDYLDTYQPPVGIVCVTAVRGRGFVVERKLIGKDDIPDVYLNITLGTSSVWRTRTVHDHLNPLWNESKEFVLHDRGQKLTVHAWDHDMGPLDPDDDLGECSALVSEILLSPQRKLELELHVQDDSLKRSQAFVTLQAQILPWTTDWASLEDTTRPSAYSEEKQIEGLLVVVINRGFRIPIPKEEVCSLVKVTYLDQEFQTKQVSDYTGVDALNPLYENAFEIPMIPGMPTTGEKAKVTLQLINVVTVKDSKDSPEEQVLGTQTIEFEALKAAKDHTITETKPIGQGGASLEYRVSLCGIKRAAKESSGGPEQQQHHEPGATPPRVLPKKPRSIRSVPTMNGGGSPADFGKDIEEEKPPQPIGKVRLTVAKARGLSISHELFNIDIPDAYGVIKFGASTEVWKTTTQSNTCNPVWNESKLYDLLDHSQVIALQLVDENERAFDPDIDLGGAKTTVGKVLLAGGSMELELTLQGKPTGIFVTLTCELVQD